MEMGQITGKVLLVAMAELKNYGDSKSSAAG